MFYTPEEAQSGFLMFSISFSKYKRLMTRKVSETAEPGKRIHIGQLLYMFYVEYNIFISRSFLCCFKNKKKFLKEKKAQNV